MESEFNLGYNMVNFLNKAGYNENSKPQQILISYLLKDKKEIIENVNIFYNNVITEKQKINDQLSLIQPKGYNPYPIPGDGACFIHTLLHNAILY